MKHIPLVENPYRPGAGHRPPFIAGRNGELSHFNTLLRQGFFSSNVLITGLRGVGKTVLLGEMRRMVERSGWIWVGNDLSESSSLSEDRIALRLLTDISDAFGRLLPSNNKPSLLKELDTAFEAGLDATTNNSVIYEALKAIYERSPGLPSDRLKAVFSRLQPLMLRGGIQGIIFAYDEAQCLADHAERNEFPMSLLVETIASVQKDEIGARCILVLCGLPQVFDALTATRTYTERMFEVMTLDRISRADTLAAIEAPLKGLTPPLHPSKELIQKVVELTGGYPYLIQFLGKELVDQLMNNGGVLGAEAFPSSDALGRLDAGLFAARWNKTTDKQREFLKLISLRDIQSPVDFSAQELSELTRDSTDMTNAQVTQMLQSLCDRGIIYRARHGRYAFTVPMSEQMILRRFRSSGNAGDDWGLSEQDIDQVPLQFDEPKQKAKAAIPEAVTVEKKKRRRWFG